MEKKEIFVTLQPSIGDLVHSYMKEKISDAGYVLNAHYSFEPFDESFVCEKIKNAYGYIVGLEKVNSNVLDAAKNLKAISKYGVGTDNIDINEAEKHGVAVSNCPGTNSNAVAEATLGLLINLARNVQNLCNDLRKNNWAVFVGSELSGKKIGIIGFGNIGRRVATLLKPFGVKIYVYDIFIDESAAAEYGVEYTSLNNIFTHADFISVHLPLSSETKHLIGKDLLSKAKKELCLVNVSRGGVVQEEAIYEAVTEGKLARAAVDVFATEPPSGYGLKMLNDDRFIVLPHTGGVTTEAVFNMTNMSIENVIAGIEEKQNPHPVKSK